LTVPGDIPKINSGTAWMLTVSLATKNGPGFRRDVDPSCPSGLLLPHEAILLYHALRRLSIGKIKK